MSKNIRWGIVGLGNIARKFAEDLQLVSDAQLIAVASRSREKATQFAQQLGAPHSFGSYQELFDFEEVDVVYIATPHTSHADLSIRAMEAGKHVLCEKPFGINSGEASQMISTAKAKGVFLMEALWSRFNPSIMKVKELADGGALGEIKYLHADFGFYALDRSEEGRILNLDLGGGSILDIGIYPIFLSYLMLGKPDTILASANFYKTGVEVQASMIFQYPSAQAILYSGLASKSEMKAEISGTLGSIFIHPRWHETQGFSLEKEGQFQEHLLPTLGKGYGNEILEVNACLAAGKLESNLWSHQNSLDLMALLDEVRRQTGVVFPFET